MNGVEALELAVAFKDLSYPRVIAHAPSRCGNPAGRFRGSPGGVRRPLLARRRIEGPVNECLPNVVSSKALQKESPGRT
jgi:hypothetical protein